MIRRAKEVLANLEKAEFNELGEPVAAPKTGPGTGGKGRRGDKIIQTGAAGEEAPEPQLGLFASEAGLLFKELQDLNLDSMTPLDALNKLHEIKKKVSGTS